MLSYGKTRLLDQFDPRRSLRVRLGLTVGSTTFIMALLISYFIGDVSRQRLQADKGQALSELAYQMVDKLDRGMFERYRDIQILATLDVVRDPEYSPSNQQVVLEKLQSTYPDYAWIGFADTQGIVQSSTRSLLQGQSVEQRPWFINARTQPFVGDVHEAKLLAKLLPTDANGQPLRFVDVAMPVHGVDGALRGVLGAHLSWTWAQEVERSLLAPIEQRQQVEILVLDRDGVVLLGPQPLQAQQLTLPTLNLNAASTGAISTERWPDGNTYLTSVWRSQGYRTYPGLSWTILVRQPTDVAFAPARELQMQFLRWGTLSGVLFGVLAWLLAGRIVRPVRQMSVAANRISQGGTDRLIPRFSGNDEIVQLSTSLNTLVTTLTEQEQALRVANTQLLAELEERRQAEAERDRLYREAQDAIKARDEFLSVAAHELKTPITNLLGFSQLMLRQLGKGGAPDPQRLQRSLTAIDLQSKKLAHLVSQLLDISRIEAGRLVLNQESVDVAALVEGVVAAQQASTQKHSLIVRTVPTTACVDPLRLEQVLTNLLDNAIKYSPDGGPITVSLQMSADTIQISVCDQGLGIAAEHRPHIFDRFFQAHAKGYYGGMGLGLYISRQIVELHGGQLEVNFPSLGGTEFVITLPTNTAVVHQGETYEPHTTHSVR